MSANSNFTQNRLKKLIGKTQIKKQNNKQSTTKKKKRVVYNNQQRQSVLFKDYTYIQLMNKQGNHSKHLNYVCYKDSHVFQDFVFPALTEKMQMDNDQDSNFYQIKQDIQKCFKNLKDQIIVCENDQFEETIESNSNEYK